jgi:hypothetical protein
MRPESFRQHQTETDNDSTQQAVDPAAAAETDLCPLGARPRHGQRELQAGGERYVPGTKNKGKRLKLVRIGERAVAAFEDEVDQLVEALRQQRDAAE